MKKVAFLKKTGVKFNLKKETDVRKACLRFLLGYKHASSLKKLRIKLRENPRAREAKAARLVLDKIFSQVDASCMDEFRALLETYIAKASAQKGKKSTSTQTRLKRPRNVFDHRGKE